jgi:hypothetical protein
MRQFINLKPHVAVDPELNIQCSSTGRMESYDSIRIYSMVYKIVYVSNNSRRDFLITKPYMDTIKKIDNVIVLNNVIGSRYGDSVSDIIALKAFCGFSGTDFEFLEYIGSAVTNSDGCNSPFRSLALVSVGDLTKAKVDVVDGVKKNEAGMIILSDSKAIFL